MDIIYPLILVSALSFPLQWVAIKIYRRAVNRAI